MSPRTIVIAPPPTPNGDLHVGHLAGPYLAADVYCRWLRGNGQAVWYATGTDDSQTYVVTSARKLGTTPGSLCRQSAYDIERTLNALGCQVDGFAPFDARYRQTVLDFLTPLYDAGKFEYRTVEFPYSPESGYLVEAYVSGTCPHCLAESRGGLCESCGLPNNYAELRFPRDNLTPDSQVGTRAATILVFPLERYREQLRAYYEARRGRWRPRIEALMRELLSKPLPDFPITYPVSWGIPSPFPNTEHQVLNAWAEGMPASMYCTTVAAEAQGLDVARPDEPWLAAHGSKLVYFLGFDNSYFWGLSHLALLMAHEGRYIVPDTIVCNEFYELEFEKFSTSRRHLIWAKDLAREVPRDLIRFYLALTSPEFARTNFSRAGLDKVVGQRWVEPWNRLVQTLRQRQPEAVLGALAVDTVDDLRIMQQRIGDGLNVEGFSLFRYADALAQHLTRLEQLAQDPSVREADLAAQAVTLVRCMAALLPDLAGDCAKHVGFDLSLSAALPVSIRASGWPQLRTAAKVGAAA
jgi:methionyl-tRNA synthetase